MAAKPRRRLLTRQEILAAVEHLPEQPSPDRLGGAAALDLAHTLRVQRTITACINRAIRTQEAYLPPGLQWLQLKKRAFFQLARLAARFGFHLQWGTPGRPTGKELDGDRYLAEEAKGHTRKQIAANGTDRRRTENERREKYNAKRPRGFKKLELLREPVSEQMVNQAIEYALKLRRST
jgi:hypothetical protein